jgi:hypothetical protein
MFYFLKSFFHRKITGLCFWKGLKKFVELFSEILFGGTIYFNNQCHKKIETRHRPKVRRKNHITLAFNMCLTHLGEVFCYQKSISKIWTTFVIFLKSCTSQKRKEKFVQSGANPTIVSYKASAVKIYNANAVKIYNATNIFSSSSSVETL